MTEQGCGSLGENPKMVLHIREQELEISALMIMRHDPSRDTPEPFNAVGIGIIGRRIDQVQVLLQLDEHAAHQQGTSGSVCLEIISHHDGPSPATFGASHGCAHLFAEHIGCASKSEPAIEPAIAPIHQAKSIDLAVVSRGLDEALPTAPFPTPESGKGRVKGELDLILQIEVGSRQQGQQIGKVGGKLIPQISLDQAVNG